MRTTAKVLKLRCYFCGDPLKSNDAHLEIYDQSTDPSEEVRVVDGKKENYGALAYPGVGEGRVSRGSWEDYARVILFTHTACGPDVGYAIPFYRLDEDWERHLRGKTWWVEEIEEQLEMARAALRAAK